MTVVDIPPRLGIDRYLHSAWARWLTLLAFILSAAIAIFVLPNHPPAPYRIDFDVYRMGGRVFLDGGDLYGTLPTLGGGSYLPFTYPPLAAALFSVFTVVPLGGLGGQGGLFTAVSIACLLMVCRIVVAHLTDRPSTDLWWLATAATTVGLWLEPVRDTLNFGQINIVLMALVVVDALLGRGRWWRGLLVGLAISIKLTPGGLPAAVPSPTGLARPRGERGVSRCLRQPRIPAGIRRLDHLLDVDAVRHRADR